MLRNEGMKRRVSVSLILGLIPLFSTKAPRSVILTPLGFQLPDCRSYGLSQPWTTIGRVALHCQAGEPSSLDCRTRRRIGGGTRREKKRPKWCCRIPLNDLNALRLFFMSCKVIPVQPKSCQRSNGVYEMSSAVSPLRV